MSKNISLRVVEPQDFEALALFLEKMLQGEVTVAIWHDHFRSWWQINPVFAPGMPMGWLLCDSSGAIGGFIGNIATNYLIDGRVRIVYAATSWYVAEDFRGDSLRLIREFRKQNAPLLDTTPTERVETILCKLGFKKLSQLWMDRDGIYPLNLQLFSCIVAAKFAKKIPKLVAGVMASGAVFIIKLQQYLMLPKAVKGKFTVEEIGEFGLDYTVFWDKLCKSYKILAVRDRVTINRLFFGTDALKSKRIVLVFKEADKLSGYIAFKIQKRKSNVKDYIYLELLDIWMSPLTFGQYKDLFRTAFSFLLEQHREIAYLTINAFNPAMFRALSQAGTFWTKGCSRFLYDKFPVINGDNFFTTSLDGDRCYFP